MTPDFSLSIIMVFCVLPREATHPQNALVGVRRHLTWILQREPIRFCVIVFPPPPSAFVSHTRHFCFEAILPPKGPQRPAHDRSRSANRDTMRSSKLGKLGVVVLIGQPKRSIQGAMCWTVIGLCFGLLKSHPWLVML